MVQAAIAARARARRSHQRRPICTGAAKRAGRHLSAAGARPAGRPRHAGGRRRPDLHRRRLCGACRHAAATWPVWCWGLAAACKLWACGPQGPLCLRDAVFELQERARGAAAAGPASGAGLTCTRLSIVRRIYGLRAHACRRRLRRHWSGEAAHRTACPAPRRSTIGARGDAACAASGCGRSQLAKRGRAALGIAASVTRRCTPSKAADGDVGRGGGAIAKLDRIKASAYLCVPAAGRDRESGERGTAACSRLSRPSRAGRCWGIEVSADRARCGS
jgi:hypothetical protein